jgi:hypothetical protein
MIIIIIVIQLVICNAESINIHNIREIIIIDCDQISEHIIMRKFGIFHYSKYYNALSY